MLTGYRGVILALGLILAVLPCGQSSYAQQAEAQQKAGDPLERIADALDEANKPKREAANCAEGGDDRKSDLCAQWKAADAAKQAAEAADWTVTLGWIGVVLGAITMGAAIAAAIFAWRAANSASAQVTIMRDEVEDARKLSSEEFRPWISYEMFNVKYLTGVVYEGSYYPKGLAIQFKFINTGKRPAFEASTRVIHEFSPTSNTSSNLVFPEGEILGRGIVAPGMVMYTMDVYILGKDLDDMIEQTSCLFVRYLAQYKKSVSASEWSETSGVIKLRINGSLPDGREVVAAHSTNNHSAMT